MKKSDKFTLVFALSVFAGLFTYDTYIQHKIKKLEQSRIAMEKQANKELQIKINYLHDLQQKYKNELEYSKVNVFTLNYNDIELLAVNNYYESRGVGNKNFKTKRQDMINITSVVLNRLDSGKYGKTLNEVLHSYKYKTNGIPVCQFSWACDSTRQKIDKNSKEWQLAYDVAFEVYTGLEKRVISKNAHHYYNPNKVDPSWAKKSKIITYVVSGHRIIEIK